jgi:short-subunit dehydrogenase
MRTPYQSSSSQKKTLLKDTPQAYEHYMHIAPPNVHYFHCDLASPEKIRTTADNIKAHLGNPTVLINNAGFTCGKTILEATQSDISLTFDINTKSHYYLAQAFLPSMIENNHGMVVTVASLAAYVTAPQMVDYSASKAAAMVFHEGLAAELATLYKAPKVRTVLICQSYTRTPLFAGFHPGDGFMAYALTPETVAEEVVNAVLSGRSAHILLPRNQVMMKSLRAWPIWAQMGVRNSLTKLMKNWKGRQVVQPSESENEMGESKTYEKVEG